MDGSPPGSQVSIYVTKINIVGVWLLAAQKPITRPGWWKGNFALFQMLATGGGGHADVCQEATPPTPATSEAGLYKQKEEATCRNRTVIPHNDHLQIDHRWCGIILVVWVRQSSVPEVCLFPFLEAGSQDCGSSLCRRCSLVIMC